MKLIIFHEIFLSGYPTTPRKKYSFSKYTVSEGSSIGTCTNLDQNQHENGVRNTQHLFKVLLTVDRHTSTSVSSAVGDTNKCMRQDGVNYNSRDIYLYTVPVRYAYWLSLEYLLSTYIPLLVRTWTNREEKVSSIVVF